MDIVNLGTPETGQLVANILLTVITIAAATATRVIQGWLRAKMNDQQLQVIGNVAASAVQAVEQMASAGIIDLDSRKGEAMDLVDEMLQKFHINLTATQIEAAIEAAVKQELNWHKKATTEPAPVDPDSEEPVA